MLGALAICAPTQAWAASNRCPDAEATFGGAGRPAEEIRISALWKMMHGPGLDGGDGPLGCPVGGIRPFSDASYAFVGVGQQFQRGWIFTPQAGSDGPEYAIVRSLGEWVVWTSATDGEFFNVGPQTVVRALNKAPGAPAFGGTVMTFPKIADTDGLMSLRRCNGQDWGDGDGCVRALPDSPINGGVFDFAARLDIRLLATPDHTARPQRIAAMIPDWLPCFTEGPADDADPGEDTVGHANIMLRRSDACPLSGAVPSDVAKAWLSTLTLPANQYPGSSIDRDVELTVVICSGRAGELDVILTQLVALRFRFLADLAGAPLAGLDAAIAPWGGSPRMWPYVDPKGLCGGRAVIETENHILLQETARYFINVASGAPNDANRDWMVRFLQQLVRRDLYEYNALPYTRYQTKALYALADFAPDDDVKTAARGVLDWIFTKLALSANMDRENRPYRRRPDDGILAEKLWWSSAMNPAAVAASLFVGPLQHLSDGPDLTADTTAAKAALLDPAGHPDLGAASDYFAASLVDAASTDYDLPAALAGWFERRFTDDDVNRLTYLQAIRHYSAQKNDPALFLQDPSGVEIVSGNRNWTMIGGGSYAIPGYLPTPPTADNQNVSIVTKAIAEKKQLDKLWTDQPGIFRETMMIPSAVGGSRQQTLRFGHSEPSARDRNGQQNRLCVAEGFMCGFDLQMPDRPFPSSDASECPVKSVLPAALTSAFQKYDASGLPIATRLGCLVKKPGLLSPYNWTVWTFEHGMLALPLSQDPDAFLGAWIQNRVGGAGGQLRVVWNSSWSADWFRVHAYPRTVKATGGEPPGGWIEPLAVSGDAGDRTKDNKGDIVYFLDGLGPDVTWDVLIVGCQKEYLFGILTGHDCTDNVLPKLTVSVGADPPNAFSCKVNAAPPPALTFFQRPSDAIVLEVGSCLPDSPYGQFVYIWSQSCPVQILSAATGVACPMNAQDFGFVVTAPSRGWSADDFRATVDGAMRKWLGDGNQYAPYAPASIDVPLAPKTERDGDKWKAVESPGKHTVTFQWASSDGGGSSVTGDSTASGLFGPGAITVDPEQWPTALGHVTAPDVPGSTTSLVSSSGNGCFSVAGLASPGESDPTGLLVDLRDAAALTITEPPTSQLAGRCQ